MAEKSAVQHLYVLVVTCVVLREDSKNGLQALVLKRSETESEGPGLWTIPGGKVVEKDWGNPHLTQSSHTVWREVLRRAVLRELLEETGIEASPEGLVYLQGGDIVFKRRTGIPTLVVTFAHFFEGSPKEVRLDDSATAYAWVGEEELNEYPCIGDVTERIKETFFECAQVFATQRS